MMRIAVPGYKKTFKNHPCKQKEETYCELETLLHNWIKDIYSGNNNATI